MKNLKSIGKICIKSTIKDSSPYTITPKLQELFNAFNIEVIEGENKSSDFEIVVEVLEIGKISDKQAKAILKELIGGRQNEDNFIKVKHNNKEFNLPEELDECIDWFIID